MTSVTSRPDQLATGIDGLDTILHGGLLRGAAYIVQGSPGAGKTILSNQICFNHTARGEIALYVSLLAESHDRMLRFLQNMSFFDPDNIPSRLTYISAYHVLQNEGLIGVVKLLAREIRRRNATLVVFDGLFVVQDLAEDEHSFRTFVHEIQGTAAITGATMLLLTNQNRQPSSPEYTMVDGWIELHDMTHNMRAIRLMEVHKQRGGGFLRGRHQFRIDDNGITVFPRIETMFSAVLPDEGSERRLTSGVPALDDMLQGGYPDQSATLLYGPTGSGKTTLGLHFVGQSTPQEAGLIVGFFETPKRLLMKGEKAGIPLAQLHASGALEILWHPPGELLVDEFCYKIVAAVERTGAKRVFIDGLTALKKGLIHPERLPVIVNALNLRLRQLGVTSIYTMENRELFLPADLQTDELSNYVDSVLLVHYAMREGLLQRNLTILKIRDSDFNSISEVFHITSRGFVFGPHEAGLRFQRERVDPTTGESTPYRVNHRTGRKVE